jgi:hypothetical protein
LKQKQHKLEVSRVFISVNVYNFKRRRKFTPKKLLKCSSKNIFSFRSSVLNCNNKNKYENRRKKVEFLQFSDVRLSLRFFGLNSWKIKTNFLNFKILIFLNFLITANLSFSWQRSYQPQNYTFAQSIIKKKLFPKKNSPYNWNLMMMRRKQADERRKNIFKTKIGP